MSAIKFEVVQIKFFGERFVAARVVVAQALFTQRGRALILV